MAKYILNPDYNTHACGWSLETPQAVKMILRQTVLPNRLYFLLLSFISIFNRIDLYKGQFRSKLSKNSFHGNLKLNALHRDLPPA